MATLPSGMAPAASSYTSDDPGGVLRTEVAGGRARYRLDWDQGRQRYAIELALNPTQLAAWMAFYHLTIKKGALPFDMPLDSGFGLSAHSVYIVPGSYSTARDASSTVRVSFVAEAVNQAYSMTSTEVTNLLALYEAFGSASMSLLLPRIAQFATVDSLVLKAV